ncbi:hypothetical protein A8C56_13265 [Niabella ginsenosidivorans]|uniref:Uncharacterized protein n=1 Tax=Niabella ginsenosidivorans TaxID=1176587 RepID=A0A1A9I549_9BACT|nr:hypothetical protein [Niabella ginsenosidivorans]ANH81820.1 hypothetical protein A8C56_13265 [Niabella ginsenosidivorans]
MADKKIQTAITDAVADTLFIPLFMRCRETHRHDAIIKDPLVCEIIRQLNYDFSRYSKGIMSLTDVAIRVRHFDNKMWTFINRKATYSCFNRLRAGYKVLQAEGRKCQSHLL